jgi:hypothetical protein
MKIKSYWHCSDKYSGKSQLDKYQGAVQTHVEFKTSQLKNTRIPQRILAQLEA